jgi:hypothetical protein
LNSPQRQVPESPILIGTAAAVMLMVIAAVYLPDVGRGFVKDDFGWIRDARAALSDPLRVWLREPGFFRPLVTSSFAVDYTLYGVNARPYGFTNLALYLACIAAIWGLLREAGVTRAAASVGAFAWALNPHGINMAVVWLSGRTSLLLTLCAALSARAFLRRQRAIGSLMLFGALLSKEEATVLPFILLAWLWLLRDEGRQALVLDAIAVCVPLIVYAVLRAQTPALTPTTAPWFYRPTTDISKLAANVFEYLDRGATFFVLVGLAAWAAYRPRKLALPKSMAVAGAVWFVGGYALTIWIPVRSSLYSVFPSVGTALICAAAVDAFRSAPSVRRTGEAWLAAAMASLLALIPVYQSRNDRWVEPARLSARALRELSAHPPESAGIVVFEDEDAQFASFTDAFGSFAAEAVSEAIQRPVAARIETTSEQWHDPAAARYRLTRGRIERVSP